MVEGPASLRLRRTNLQSRDYAVPWAGSNMTLVSGDRRGVHAAAAEVVACGGKATGIAVACALALPSEGSELSSIKVLAQKLGSLRCIELHCLFLLPPKLPDFSSGGLHASAY